MEAQGQTASPFEQLMQALTELQAGVAQLSLKGEQQDSAIQALGGRLSQLGEQHDTLLRIGERMNQLAPLMETAAVAAAPARQEVEPTANSSGSSHTKVPYAKLALKPGTHNLNMSLENWLVATRSAFSVNRVATHQEVEVAVLAAMEGHVQAVCLEMFRAGLLADWNTLTYQLSSNFSQQDRQQAAALELERLKMQGSSKSALESYIGRSRALHLTAGSEVSELQRYRYFMRGMENQLRELIGGLIAAQGHPTTFEFASNLALKIVANRQEPGSSSNAAAAPTPMELNAMQWQARGSGRQWQPRRQQPGRAGGSRALRPLKGKGRIPGTWKPRMSSEEKRSLLNKGLCLCCKTSTDHGWRDCPRNPDNRGNA